MTTMTAVAATAGQWTLAHTSSGGSIQVINNSPTVPLMVRAGDTSTVADTDVTTLGNMTVPPLAERSLPGLASGDIVLVRPIGSDDGKVTIRPYNDAAATPVPSSGEITSVVAAAASTTLLAANSARKGASIYNDSTATLYIAIANVTASATVFTEKLAAGESYELPRDQGGVYTGIIKGIWSSATGNARVTERT